MIDGFGAFGVVRPTRSKSDSVVGRLFWIISGSFFGNWFLGCPVNYDQMQLSPICFEIDLSISLSSSLIVEILKIMVFYIESSLSISAF